MARARNIKPAIMDNEDLAELQPLTRLLFVYLWMLADREGRLEDRPKRIAAQALAYDRTADVDAMLGELLAGGFIARYVAAGVSIIQIVSFSKHQTPHGTERDSGLPNPDGQITVHTRGKNGYATGEFQLINSVLTVKSPSDNTLIPDTGFTDSLIPDSLPPSGGSALPTPGEVCKAMKAAGLSSLSPSNPTLIALIAEGMTLDEFVSAAEDAVEKKKPFAYALAIAQGRRRDAAAIAALPPRAPNARGSPQSFAESDRLAAIKRWEERTNRVHPDNPNQGDVIDVTPAIERIAS